MSEKVYKVENRGLCERCKNSPCDFGCIGEVVNCPDFKPFYKKINEVDE